MRARRNSGFTLVELVVASTLIVLVMSGVYLTFTTAVRTWRSAESNYTTYEDARRALGQLDRELHAIPGDAIHLTSGTNSSIEFVTLAQPMDVETASSERLLLVSYRYASGRHGGQLVREEAPVTSPLPAAPDPRLNDLPAKLVTGRSHSFVLAEGVRSFALTYSWAGGQMSTTPGSPPGPARILTDTMTQYALPEMISATLEVDDPGNIVGGGTSVFRERVTFRGPTSPIPESLKKKSGP